MGPGGELDGHDALVRSGPAVRDRAEGGEDVETGTRGGLSPFRGPEAAVQPRAIVAREVFDQAARGAVSGAFPRSQRSSPIETVMSPSTLVTERARARIQSTV